MRTAFCAEARKAEEQKKAEEAKKGEEQRKAEEAKKAEEQKRAEEAKKAEEQRKAVEAKKAEEQKRAEEAKKAEEQRKAEEAKKAEEQKKAEEAKKAEEQRKAEEAKKAEEQKRAEEAKKAEEQKRAEEAAKKAEEQKKAEEAKKAEANNTIFLSQEKQNPFLNLSETSWTCWHVKGFKNTRPLIAVLVLWWTFLWTLFSRFSVWSQQTKLVTGKTHWGRQKTDTGRGWLTQNNRYDWHKFYPEMRVIMAVAAFVLLHQGLAMAALAGQTFMEVAGGSAVPHPKDGLFQSVVPKSLSKLSGEHGIRLGVSPWNGFFSWASFDGGRNQFPCDLQTGQLSRFRLEPPWLERWRLMMRTAAATPRGVNKCSVTCWMFYLGSGLKSEKNDISYTYSWPGWAQIINWVLKPQCQVLKDYKMSLSPNDKTPESFLECQNQAIEWNGLCPEPFACSNIVWLYLNNGMFAF